MCVVPKRNLLQYGRQFLVHVLPAVVKPARTLWHEVIGFLFLTMAILIAGSSVRLLRNFSGEPGDIMRLAMAGFCVLLLGYYGVSSFLRARKISRS
jgi:hypothetical protein